MEKIKDIIYPRRCPVCEEIATPKGYLICRDCIKKLPFIKEPHCIKCGKALISDDEAYCDECIKEREFISGRALCHYNEDLKRIILKIKYNNKREYIDAFGKLMAIRFKSYVEAADIKCIVPVPLHKSKLKVRGFNQSELLSTELSRYFNIPVRYEYLSRIKNTKDQKGLSREERLHNLDLAFSAKKLPEDIDNILLIDDVYTTGTTIEKCAQALKMSGGKNIYFLTICTGDN